MRLPFRPRRSSLPAAGLPAVRAERVLMTLAVNSQQFDHRLARMEQRLDALDTAELTLELPTHDDLLEVRLHSARLSAEVARVTVELQGGSTTSPIRCRPSLRRAAAYESAPAPSWYGEIDAVGHNGFDDFCTFGNGTGIIGVAEASGLDAFLDSQPQLRALGEDGCVDPAAPIEDASPIIRHGVTSWLRWLFEEDPEPARLDPETNGAFDLGIAIESK